jgi:SNF2 family DNA or RNA helicase
MGLVVTRAFKPHAYQEEAMRFLYDVPRCALWMPMGGGKTVSTLTALDNLSLVEDVFPVLVLAPLRVARSTWPDEVQKWEHLSHLRVSAICGSAKERKAALDTQADIYTMNYDNLVWLTQALGGDWPFKTVVADEFTRLKSFRLRQGSKRARALGAHAHKSVTRFIGLTGTPSSNGLKDLWGQTWFLDKGQRLGRTFSAFEQSWFRKGYDGFSIHPLPTAQRDIEVALRDICLTVTGLQVDEPISNPIYVDLPRGPRSLYDDMEREMFVEIGAEGVEAANAAVRTSKCLQMSNGALYVDEEGNWEEVHDAKLEALDSIIEEANGAPVLVAYNFKHDLARLQKRYPRGRVLDTQPDTIKQWNRGEIGLLFAHPASAGHGLNLADGGNILAFFGVNWNLEEHMQIIERIGPMRQKQAGHDRPVFIYPILARDTVDDLVMDRLTSKKSVQEVLLEAMKRKAQK